MLKIGDLYFTARDFSPESDQYPPATIQISKNEERAEYISWADLSFRFRQINVRIWIKFLRHWTREFMNYTSFIHLHGPFYF